MMHADAAVTIENPAGSLRLISIAVHGRIWSASKTIARDLLRNLLNGAGIAALILFPTYQGAISNPSSMRMHSPLPLTTFALATVADLLFVSVLVALLCMWMESTRPGQWIRFCLPALYAGAAIEGIYIYRTGSPKLKYFWGGFALTLLLTWILRRFWPAAYQRMQAVRLAFATGLAVFCIFAMVQLVRLAFWRPTPILAENFTLADSQPRPPHPRVVWILMDELSYDQVFGKRAQGLDLPNFDALHQMSTLFTDTEPVTEYTESAVPSLLEGRLISSLKYTPDNRLLVAGQGQPLSPFRASNTPFAIAKSQEMTTGVVGWFNPYCSMLAPYLDKCYWTDEAMSQGAPLTEDAFWRFVAKPWVAYWTVLYPHQRNPSIVNQARDYRSLSGQAQDMVNQEQMDFIFLHLPLPHPPGFYNRRAGQFEADGRTSYLDNLALADKTLGELLSILRASPRWSGTSIVLCGDHSWRTFKWEKQRYWTSEDEAASHGGAFDPRPMLMVHQAGQTASATVDHPVSLMKVHDILDRLIVGQPLGLQ